MDSYSVLREFADSWFLIGMVALFVGAVLWAFRPGASGLHRDAAAIPFRNEDRPAADAKAVRATAKDVRS